MNWEAKISKKYLYNTYFYAIAGLTGYALNSKQMEKHIDEINSMKRAGVWLYYCRGANFLREEKKQAPVDVYMTIQDIFKIRLVDFGELADIEDKEGHFGK